MLKAIGLALVALFLAAPLAAAHSCEDGEVGVDLNHDVIVCVHTPRGIVCVLVPHACADPTVAATSESLSLP